MNHTRGESPRVVQVLPDVAAIDRVFDYEVNERDDERIRVGSIVRIDLHGRRVRGWVVAEGSAGAEYGTRKQIAKVSPGGVEPGLVVLAQWAAWRWAGTRRPFLATASGRDSFRIVPPSRRDNPNGVEARTGDGWVDAALAQARSVVRLGPAIDPWPIVDAAVKRGPSLVLVPSAARADRLARRVRDAGAPHAIAVGARAGAWAPCPGMSSVVVIDAQDEAYAEERAPTWNAWVVASERAARAAVPCVLVSATPTLEQLAWGSVVETDRATERNGWARVEVVDRRGDDPRTGLWSRRVVDVLRGAERSLCVLNRTGRARLLACNACGTVATCERCAAAVHQNDDKQLVCTRCGTERPTVCQNCGAARLKLLRIGTARAAEELQALLDVRVGEVTAASKELPDTAVIVGTEAVLHRVGRADVVVFVDLDAELSAPFFRANEAALGLIARASRVVRGRGGDGRIVVQTRQPEHPVLKAAVASDPSRLVAVDEPMRRDLVLPPFSALAQVVGDGAAAFLDGLRHGHGVDVIGPDAQDGFLVRAPDHSTLADALSRGTRGSARVRVAVDPIRL